MKALILTLGTRGDVQPFVALARGLTEAGHEAVLAAPHRFEGFVRKHGVLFTGIDDGPMRLLDRDSGSVVGDVAAGGPRAKLTLAGQLPAMFAKVFDDCLSVAVDGAGAGADVLVHNGQVVAGQHVAEKLVIPAVLALPIPRYVPTREFPWAGMAVPRWLPSALNWATYLARAGAARDQPPRAAPARRLAGRRAGVRAVVGTGWGGLAADTATTTVTATATDDVFAIDEVPYEQLFPRVAAVIHHGGAGTVAAAAAAGRPQVVCPFVADQPFWGWRVHDLGVATEPIGQRHLTSDRLASAIHQAITDSGLTDTAAELGTRIRAEEGIRNAVRQLENLI